MSTSANPNGKAPMGAEDAARYGGNDLITVEPPKQSDLQVSPKIVTYPTYLLAIFRPFDARRSCEPRMVWEND